MTFQVVGLRPEEFAAFFTMSADELARRNARKMVVTASPGTPCRVSLADAEVGRSLQLARRARANLAEIAQVDDNKIPSQAGRRV